MKFVLYNDLGIFALCATICLATLLMVSESLPGYSALAWVVGCVLVLLDISCRVRLYWVDPAPGDCVLSLLSAPGGGQFFSLPIWLWGGLIIMERLWQISLLVLFAISLILADIVYRLRRASLENQSLVGSLVNGSGLLPPLWLLASLLFVFAMRHLGNQEGSGWPSATLTAIGILMVYATIRLVRQSIMRKEPTVHHELSSAPLLQAASSPHQEKPSSSWWQRLRQHFPWRQFVLGALIPMLIFYLLSRVGQPLLGAVLAGGWGLGVVLVGYWRSRRIDLFAGMALAMAVIELLILALTRNPDFYLASEAIQSAAYGVLFLGSLVFSRSLIQLLAEETGATANLPAHLRCSPDYRTAWHLLSTVWGGVSLLKAGLLFLAQWGLTLETFLAIRTLSGFPILASLLAFSFWFPGWYWRRGGLHPGRSRILPYDLT